MTDSEINAAYLKGYEEAKQRCQLNIASAVDEIARLRLVLEDALELVDEPTKAHIQSIMQRKR
jgi:hypothetical protein